MYCDASKFEFIPTLEQRWEVIKAELEALPPEVFVPYPERYLLDKRTGWDIVGLYFLGVKIDLNCELCPQTASLVKAIPGLITAGFSRLAPGAHIVPHAGKPVGVLRCHMGIDVPPRCGLRVGQEIRRWENGRCMVFDDTSEHEAWNLDERYRTVLLLDFKAPDWYTQSVRAA
jgi:ornithine lipid ester-linked acyl 2-hydroxylase